MTNSKKEKKNKCNIENSSYIRQLWNKKFFKIQDIFSILKTWTTSNNWVQFSLVGGMLDSIKTDSILSLLKTPFFQREQK